MVKRTRKRSVAGVKIAAAATRPSFPVVGVGASAGGLEAFSELLRAIPPGSGMAFVLVQHLDPSHPSYLGEALSRATTLPVIEVRDGMPLEPDHVYVMPSTADLGIRAGCLTLLPRPKEAHGPHLPIDLFFEALAQDCGSQAIGIVLSGTGADGSEGLRAIKGEGGVTFAQAPGSAKFAGMPEAAIRTGAVDFTLPLPELAAELARVGRHPFVARAAPAGEEPFAGPGEGSELEKVLVLLRAAVGVDFGGYKTASLRRRIARRMALRRMTELKDYVQLLRDDREEARALYEEILVHVTSFFRDPEAFERLKEVVFPKLLEKKHAGSPLRLWSAGCSTGEEAYSLVIALFEFLEGRRFPDVAIQLFGTDLSEQAIEVARAGLYPEGALRDLGAGRLARFFTREESGAFRIARSIRERCVFVTHDLTRDPPFSRLDLVSCRNVLIYFGRELQQRLLATFHFALNDTGFLLLGRAESPLDGSALFAPVDEEQKIYARTAVASRLHLAPAREAPGRGPGPLERLPTIAQGPGDVVRRAEALLLDRYVPPGVVVNERMEILQFVGRTGPYLEPAPGEPRHDLIKMARGTLGAELRIALSQAKKEGRAVRREGVRVSRDGGTTVCDIAVLPLTVPPESGERVFAVLFEPAKAGPASPEGPQPAPSPNVQRLEEELRESKDSLQAIIEEHLRTNDDLRSANEELLSSNEELQSLNEELQTAKEELQSTNEELSTLNDELQARNGELASVNGDLMNVLASVEIPIVIVDGARRIRRFTPKARPILNLLPTDVGRPIDDIKPALEIEGLERKIAEVIDSVQIHEEEVRDRDGRWYRLQIRPYTTVDKRIDGAVLSIVDIDRLKRAIGAAEWSRDYAEATVEAVQIPLCVLDERLRVSSANEAFHLAYGLSRAEVVGHPFAELLDGRWNLPSLQAALHGVLATNDRFQRLPVQCELPRVGLRSLSFSAQALPAPGGDRLLLLAIEDVTERERAAAERERLLQQTRDAQAAAEAATRAKDVFLATVSHELRTPLSSLLLQSQLLRRGPLGEARVRKLGEGIERATLAQATLIDDLLDISRIVTGKLRIEPRAVRLQAIVQGAVETVRESAARRGVRLEVELDDSLPTLRGDPSRLQQVVLNLLTNAIKFTPEGGTVAVTVDRDGGSARLRVRDTGIGIAAPFLSEIFDRFSQESRGLSRGHGGLGLGLAIVRHLVEAHGGTVRAESEGTGKGATFTVELPLLEAGVEAPPASAPPLPERAGAAGRRLAGANVLVVEDDQVTRELLVEMLELEGAIVRFARSASEALERFGEARPDLLLCDLSLPGGDGYGLLRRIRGLGPARGGDVPAVALTALASDEDRRRSADSGFQLHLAKPIGIDRLVSALASLRTAPPPEG